MSDRLSARIRYTECLIEKLSSGEEISKEDLSAEVFALREWIGFFQHERLIHLLVTFLFSILSIGSFFVFVLSLYLPTLVIFAVFMLLLVPYIFHYYKLENGVQKLYDLYDRLALSSGGKNG